MTDPGIAVHDYEKACLGLFFALADASVRFISDKVSLEVLKALSTPAGGEPLDPRDWE